ncbi:glutaredoxin family protein [Natranaerofaba carboxydovora]|uniref:glutaredoxin family protein n=1 Tax=Natranaerofaba carboxydovora TaxID=2742683 RepID=UPI001F1320DE|nr:glutaredoxin domain-containing protein [Natranaerofaba carboxydovora]UMZ72913.1 Glutaredoxin [Natranaerofaba carboxydovora]
MAKATIYTKTGCPYSRIALKYYNKKGFEIEEINTSYDEIARQKVIKEYKADKVPVIFENDKLVSIGFRGGG